MTPGSVIHWRFAKPSHLQPGDQIIDDRFDIVRVDYIQKRNWRRYWVDVSSDDGLITYPIPAKARYRFKVIIEEPA